MYNEFQSNIKYPIRPGYVLNKDVYDVIAWNMYHNIDTVLYGEAGSGKTYTVEVMSEANEWNLVPVERLSQIADLIGYLVPKLNSNEPPEYVASTVVKALIQDPSVIKYPGHKTVVFIDEAFRALSEMSGLWLQLVGNGDRGILATPNGIYSRAGMDMVFVFADNTCGDGGNTSYISAKPIDNALKSRLNFIEVQPTKDVAKAICGEDKELLSYYGWMVTAVNKGKVDRSCFDVRGLNQFLGGNPMTPVKERIKACFLKGMPASSIATTLKNVTSKNRTTNRYFIATVEVYNDLCTAAGMNPTDFLTTN